MAEELRRIVFTKEELQAAAVAYCLHANIPLPAADVESLEVGDDVDETMVLTFSTAKPAAPHVLRLSRDQVAAALVRHCHDHEIPLPRHGKKVLHAQKDGLSMMIRLEAASLPPLR